MQCVSADVARRTFEQFVDYGHLVRLQFVLLFRTVKQEISSTIDIDLHLHIRSFHRSFL